MDGDDGLEAAGAVLTEHDLFMAALFRAEEGLQYVSLRAGYVGHGGDSQEVAASGTGPRKGGGGRARRLDPDPPRHGSSGRDHPPPE
ncbi:hypothetical protein GCM10010524_36260 [Streptomyces mexicanus]